jgi:hypothetical protein
MTPRFHLFAGDTYYPNGGTGDYVKSLYNVDEVKAHFILAHEDEKTRNYQGYDWAEIVESTDNGLVSVANWRLVSGWVTK